MVGLTMVESISDLGLRPISVAGRRKLQPNLAPTPKLDVDKLRLQGLGVLIIFWVRMCGWKFRLLHEPNLQHILKPNFLFYPPINKLLYKFKGTGHDFCWSGKPNYHFLNQENVNKFPNK